MPPLSKTLPLGAFILALTAMTPAHAQPAATTPPVLHGLAPGADASTPMSMNYRPPDTQTYAEQQKSQNWATRKIALSPLRHEWVTVRLGDRTLKAFATYPQGRSSGPVVIVGHEVFGLTDSTKNTADEIAQMGYITLAPDFLSGLGPDGGGTESFATTRLTGPANSERPTGEVNADFTAWCDFAAHMPGSSGKVAIVGLSWAGGSAFRYAAAPGHCKALKAVFVFYDVGPPTSTQGPTHKSNVVYQVPYDALDVPVFGFYPGYDKRVIDALPATKAAMAAKGKRFYPEIYAEAEHGYMRVGEDPRDPNPANIEAVKASLARLRRELAKI